MSTILRYSIGDAKILNYKPFQLCMMCRHCQYVSGFNFFYALKLFSIQNHSGTM